MQTSSDIGNSILGFNPVLHVDWFRVTPLLVRAANGSQEGISATTFT